MTAVKKTAVIPALAVLCLLTGCQSWQSGSYLVVEPHAGQYTQTEPVELVQASSYLEIRDTITDMADTAATSCVIGVDDYQGDLESDMEKAISYATEQDPVGAYAFSGISYSFDRIGNMNVVIVEPTFRHSKAEIEAIESVRYGISIQRKIAEALDEFLPSLTLWVSGYQEMDFGQFVEDYCDDNPDKIMEYPAVSVAIYPDSGSSRIVELKFSYETSRDTMWTMQGAVETIFSSAEGYVSLTEDEYTKANRLCSFLMELFDYVPEHSVTPTYSLLCQGVGDSRAYANVFAAMCRQAGLWCQRVDGTRNGEAWSWNILQVNGAYTYVDLMGDDAQGQPSFRGDDQMDGYEWDREAYPACEEVFPPAVTWPEVTGQGQGPEPEAEKETETEPAKETEPTQPSSGEAETSPPDEMP